MSTAADEENTMLTPQSSKKRKMTAATPERSAKKRKHEKSDTGPPTPQENKTQKKDKSRKGDKRKKRDATKDLAHPEVPTLQDDEDIELPDAQTEPLSADSEAAVESLPVLNGAEDEAVEDEQEIDHSFLQSQQTTSFYEKRLSLLLPISAISLATPTSSILSQHLAPLLLTYFPPAEGIVLSFSDPVLSARPNYGVNLPLKPPRSGMIPRNPHDETFARCADAYGVSWVWLTATFLLFQPQPGDELKGWTNVASEGFVGLVSYNYFQAAVGKSRIPKNWSWDGPTREGPSKKKRSRKGKLRDEDDVPMSQDEVSVRQDTMEAEDRDAGNTGTFVDSSGNAVASTQTFRVVDVEMVPGHERDKWMLQIDGSLLSQSEEAAVLEEEKKYFEQRQNRSRSRSRTPGTEDDDGGGMPLLSGSVSFSREPSFS